jgi:hypothetical protein
LKCRTYRSREGGAVSKATSSRPAEIRNPKNYRGSIGWSISDFGGPPKVVSSRVPISDFFSDRPKSWPIAGLLSAGFEAFPEISEEARNETFVGEDQVDFARTMGFYSPKFGGQTRTPNLMPVRICPPPIVYHPAALDAVAATTKRVADMEGTPVLSGAAAAAMAFLQQATCAQETELNEIIFCDSDDDEDHECQLRALYERRAPFAEVRHEDLHFLHDGVGCKQTNGRMRKNRNTFASIHGRPHVFTLRVIAESHTHTVSIQFPVSPRVLRRCILHFPSEVTKFLVRSV